ncbi:hypothetical protein IWX48DRAFT_135177 [Phyllosticta citricarpa]
MQRTGWRLPVPSLVFYMCAYIVFGDLGSVLNGQKAILWLRNRHSGFLGLSDLISAHRTMHGFPQLELTDLRSVPAPDGHHSGTHSFHCRGTDKEHSSSTTDGSYVVTELMEWQE